MMLTIRNLIATGLFAFTMDTTQADTIVEDFGDYAPKSSVKAGQTNFGEAADGWLTPWRATVSNAVTVATIASDQPLASGGKYISSTITCSEGKTPDEGVGGSLARGYDADAISSSGTAPYSIRFDFRADAAQDNVRFNLSDASQRSAFYDSTASWVLSAYDGKWHAGSGLKSTDLGLPFRAGVVYQITVTLNPSTLTWDVAISSDAGSATLQNLAFRTKEWATDSAVPNARWLIFSASEPSTTEKSPLVPAPPTSQWIPSPSANSKPTL